MELGSKKYKFGPKSNHERSTNAAEFGKSFEFFSFSCKFRSKLSNRIENKIQLVCIEDLKNTCFKPKIDDIRLKFCRIGNCRQLCKNHDPWYLLSHLQILNLSLQFLF